MTLSRPSTPVLLGAIILIGLGLRCLNLGFGLPAMYDPDEPLFVLKAFKLLDDHTLNPAWFGHPGTTTIYLLALIDVVVALVGLSSGRFANLSQFAAAVYAHPGLIFVPSRAAMVLIAVGTIWVTFLLARRLFDPPTALVAAAFLSLNGLHIAWSAVIRTDIQSSLFMLASMLFGVRAAQDGRMRSFVIAGLFAGFATATKWPGGGALIASGGAALHLWRAERDGKLLITRWIASGLSLLAGLFVASPYIFLDWPMVVASLGGEVAAGHLGHNGAGLVDNLGWYLRIQTVGSMGWIGLALAVAGMAMMFARPIARVTLLPVALVFLVLISAQIQIWSRWLTPVLPMLCIAAAFAAVRAARWVARLGPPRLAEVVRLAIPALALIPSAAGAVGDVREHANDTRDQASAWAIAHIPPGSTVLVEHLALNLRPQPWQILFPIGAAGCVDGRNALKGGVKLDRIQKARQGSPIVDLGNLPAEKVSSCRGDYAILTYYDLYVAEGKLYPAPLRRYGELIGTGRTVALFRPVPGRVGGPVTRIVSLNPARFVTRDGTG